MRFEYCASPRAGASLVRVQLWRVDTRRAKFAGSFALPPAAYAAWRDSFAWGSVHMLSELVEVPTHGNGRRHTRK